MNYMKKRFICLSVLLASSFLAGSAAAADKGAVTWKLKYTENFNGTRLRDALWARIDKGKSDWNKNMSTREDLVAVKGGYAHLYGVKNNDKAADPRSVLTGGIMTKGRFAMKYAKIEIRCKFEGQKGAWPAIWMMPQNPVGGWPDCGEIDIVERLNFDKFVYQTVHSGWTRKHPNNPPKGGRGNIDSEDWNVYGLEWTEDGIVWTVNGKRTHSYPRKGDDPSQFPWTVPFYLMIDMQLGGTWVGSIDESTLPVTMYVDWVKFYEGSRGGRKFTEFVRPGK